MITEMMAVFDTAIQSYGQPFFVQHVNAGIRSFKNECNNVASPFNSNPGDYELYHVGSFNSDTGELVSVGSLIMARGKDVIDAPF